MADLTFQIIDLDARTRDFLAKYAVGAGKRVLDVGCGAGVVSFLAADLVGVDGEVVGIDRNQEAILRAAEKAEERGAPASFHPADLHGLPSDLGKFDAIIGRRVLMYLPDPAATLRSLAALLKPAGVMAFEEIELSMVPVFSSSLPLHEKVYGWLETMLAAEEVNRNMGIGLASAMTAAGLQPTHVEAEAVVETAHQQFDIGWRLRAMKQRLLDAGIEASQLESLDDIDDRLVAERAQAKATCVSQMAFRCVAARAGGAVRRGGQLDPKAREGLKLA